jgi:hypothetical protein
MRRAVRRAIEVTLQGPAAHEARPPEGNDHIAEDEPTKAGVEQE